MRYSRSGEPGIREGESPAIEMATRRARIDEIETELASALVQTLVSSGLISNREERSAHSSIMDILGFAGRLSQGNRQRSSCGLSLQLHRLQKTLINHKMISVCFLVTTCLQDDEGRLTTV